MEIKVAEANLKVAEINHDRTWVNIQQIMIENSMTHFMKWI